MLPGLLGGVVAHYIRHNENDKDEGLLILCLILECKGAHQDRNAFNEMLKGAHEVPSEVIMNFAFIKNFMLGNSIIRHFTLIVSNNSRKHTLSSIFLGCLGSCKQRGFSIDFKQSYLESTLCQQFYVKCRRQTLVSKVDSAQCSRQLLLLQRMTQTAM